VYSAGPNGEYEGGSGDDISCRVPEISGASLVEAANASIRHAVQDNIDLKDYELSSVAELGNGNTDLIRYGSSEPYERQIVEQLKGRRYWQACYTHKDPEVAGAMFCYFLNRIDLTLLTAYRVK
jgi:hypothetical protein